MTNVFDELDCYTADHIKAALWRGDAIAAISREHEVAKSIIHRMRDELFSQYDNPQAVIAAANGPHISANFLNRPKGKRKSPNRQRAEQIEVF